MCFFFLFCKDQVFVKKKKKCVVTSLYTQCNLVSKYYFPLNVYNTVTIFCLYSISQTFDSIKERIVCSFFLILSILKRKCPIVCWKTKKNCNQLIKADEIPKEKCLGNWYKEETDSI